MVPSYTLGYIKSENGFWNMAIKESNLDIHGCFFWHYFLGGFAILSSYEILCYMQMTRTQFNVAKQRVQSVLDWKFPNWIFNQSEECQILIMACWSCSFQNNAKVANPCLKIRKSWIYMNCTLGKFDSGWQSRSIKSILMTQPNSQHQSGWKCVEILRRN